jgi:hypothetical protein
MLVACKNHDNACSRRKCLGTRLKLCSHKIQFFFLLKFNTACTFWIVLMCWCQKWFLKNKKNHWYAFRHEKLFEKQPLPHCQTCPKLLRVEPDFLHFKSVPSTSHFVLWVAHSSCSLHFHEYCYLSITCVSN